MAPIPGEALLTHEPNSGLLVELCTIIYVVFHLENRRWRNAVKPATDTGVERPTPSTPFVAADFTSCPDTCAPVSAACFCTGDHRPGRRACTHQNKTRAQTLKIQKSMATLGHVP